LRFLDLINTLVAVVPRSRKADFEKIAPHQDQEDLSQDLF